VNCVISKEIKVVRLCCCYKHQRTRLSSTCWFVGSSEKERGIEALARACVCVCVSECGRSVQQSLNTGPYIVHGNDAAAGRWPWHVAILRDENVICGASLVDEYHVITAAHCIRSVALMLLLSLWHCTAKH